MTITMNRIGNELTVALEGRLDTMTARELEEALEPALDGVTRLIYDFAELQYISSSGLRVLLMTMKIMNAQGEMIVRNVCPNVYDVLEVTGFSSNLNIE